MQIKVSDEEISQLIVERLIEKGLIGSADEIESFNFDYNSISECLTGVTVELKKKLS